MFLHIIPVIEGQFFPSVNISQGHNPDSASGEFCNTIRITGMIDIAGGVAEYFSVDIVLSAEGKDVDIPLVYTLGTFGFGNAFPSILDNPGILCDVLGGKQSLACDP